ncbi:Rossmann-like and DUF2520 domain-containing protein [Psychrilyobacter atlanticus]|uniref:Rossmann-like and DUF2520 domain-containing protein n=1 Tax=Psychrilyobacter atlanticus TaxID=271091 RepID=UPI0003FD0D41|nr:DUF2520 domain-containing protein [Psychrilyobacter atlanticus]
MRIGIIGAGRVGISLGKYLRYRNFSISGYLKRERKENVIDPSKLGWESFESYTEIVEQSDIILIAVPDDEIIDVWNKLSRENIEGRCVIHTSGAVSSEIFCNAEELGAEAASLHPMMTFSDIDTPMSRMEEMSLVLEGDSPQAKKIVEGLGNKCFSVEKKFKMRYHLAGVYASNLIVPMIHRGIDNLQKCGFSEKEAKDILLPLVEKTVENIGEKGIKDSITGPLQRGDLNTLRGHLNSQERWERDLYLAGSRELLKIIGENKEIEGILEDKR